MNYSVLMSLYDGENPEYVRPSIDSMINQTIRPDEIVIVLDGPINSGLQDIIDEYFEEFPDLFVIVPLKNNIGLGKALNAGLKVCSNELVARMDTDDISLPDRCEKQLQTFKNQPDLAIVGSNIDEFSENPSEIYSSRVVPSQHNDIVKFSKTRSPFNHPTIMYKKSAVLDSGGYGDFRRNQDYDLFVRMLNYGYKAENINESLLLFRANSDNIKRRKSWNKIRGDISIRYNFLKKGYINWADFLISTTGFLGSYILPARIFEKISSNVLRQKK